MNKYLPNIQINWIEALPKILVYVFLICSVVMVKQLPYFNVYLPLSYCLIFLWVAGIWMFRPKQWVTLTISMLFFIVGAVVQITGDTSTASEFVTAGYYICFILFFRSLRVTV